MKKVLLVISLLLLGAIGHAAIEQVKLKTKNVISVTAYTGSDIIRYNLGDTDCYISKSANGISCLRR